MSQPPTKKVLLHYAGLLMKNSMLSFSWHACFASILLSLTLRNHIKRICEHATEFIWKNSWRWKGICCFRGAQGLSHGDLPSRTLFVLEGKKGLKIQVICWKRWLHLADFLNSDGVRYRFLSDPFFFIPILRNQFQQDYIISKIEMHRLQFSWPIPISDFLEVWPADTDFCQFRFSF